MTQNITVKIEYIEGTKETSMAKIDYKKMEIDFRHKLNALLDTEEAYEEYMYLSKTINHH